MRGFIIKKQRVSAPATASLPPMISWCKKIPPPTGERKPFKLLTKLVVFFSTKVPGGANWSKPLLLVLKTNRKSCQVFFAMCRPIKYTDSYFIWYIKTRIVNLKVWHHEILELARCPEVILEADLFVSSENTYIIAV